MSTIEHNLVPGKKVIQQMGAPIYPDQARARPATVRALILLQLLLGVGALFGGGVLILAPDGHLIGMPMNLLANSPFTNFLVPGLLLFFFVGVFPSVVAYSLRQRPGWRWPNLLNPFKRMHWSWAASLAAGVAVVVWIVVEIQFMPVGFVHLLYLAWGALILILTLLPSVRRHFALPASAAIGRSALD
jgi:hypothetical protein